MAHWLPVSRPCGHLAPSTHAHLPTGHCHPGPLAPWPLALWQYGEYCITWKETDRSMTTRTQTCYQINNSNTTSRKISWNISGALCSHINIFSIKFTKSVTPYKWDLQIKIKELTNIISSSNCDWNYYNASILTKWFFCGYRLQSFVWSNPILGKTKKFYYFFLLDKKINKNA